MMDSKTFIVTGGNSGLGYQCAKNIALTNSDYHVVIACRNLIKAANAVKQLINETQNKNIHSLELDLASLDSIRQFCKVFIKSNLPPLYALVCNAGVGGFDSTQLTKDGFKLIFGVNHLGHFLLANLLLRNLLDNGRIVFVSSDMHNPPKFMASNFGYTSAKEIAFPKTNNSEENKSHNHAQYPISKLCNIYCTYEMATRIKGETTTQITVNAFNPGFMEDTSFSGDSKTLLPSIARFVAPIIALLLGVKSTSIKSGKLLALLVTSPNYEGVSGKYFDRDKEIKSSELSYSKENAKDLWNTSIELANIQQNETILSV